MKRNLTLIFLPLSILFFAAACSKDDADGKEYCVECTMKETSSISGMDPTVTTMTTENCGWSEQTLNAYLKSGNTTITSSSSGTTITIKYETTCNKK